jgi:hypothetical protein
MYSYNAHLSFVENFFKSAVTYLMALNMQLPVWNDWIVKAIFILPILSCHSTDH